jgi:hypothetical protein
MILQKCDDNTFFVVKISNLFGNFNLGTLIEMREKLLQIDDKSFYFVLNFR